ncbi:hypothetical protein QQ008_25060 [Fulvivirgaceae bacterium BMA10]|uniref:Lipoprotein n=1 Tax=Splendidivirga corallicola TaxID=3051826 RepID=A0ABT8KV86_9BACT|nr:hypothetical protein [Fulvivirgaceae bacterium BMA10]
MKKIFLFVFIMPLMVCCTIEEKVSKNLQKPNPTEQHLKDKAELQDILTEKIQVKKNARISITPRIEVPFEEWMKNFEYYQDLRYGEMMDNFKKRHPEALNADGSFNDFFDIRFKKHHDLLMDAFTQIEREETILIKQGKDPGEYCERLKNKFKELEIDLDWATHDLNYFENLRKMNTLAHEDFKQQLTLE